MNQPTETGETSKKPALTDTKLKIRTVGTITDHFTVPAYQRGYRWERKQVRQLLDDIEHTPDKSPYYLQPIVVAPDGNGGYDLIDGQQRLTTLFLVYKMLETLEKKLSVFGLNIFSGINLLVPYQIEYETRDFATGNFLKGLAKNSIDELFQTARAIPDTLYMWHACKEILTWFDMDLSKMQKIAKALNERVRIIWYELEQSIDCWEKFADLNVGKIPLTNSELIKALFMRDDGDNQISEHDKAVIINQWDSIERELSDKMFWNFLTNRDINSYDTKIDLLFDIIANKQPGEHDEFFTFFKFDEMYGASAGRLGKKTWNEIYLQYLRLRDWYEDPTNELYHKIGFLVTVDERDKVLRELFEFSKGKTHDKFREELDSRIRKTIALPLINKDDNQESADARIRLKELRYGVHDTLIKNILTLFNVLTVQQMADKTQRYSFHHHKNVEGGWSLEHIHAQKSDVLNTEEQWTTWVKLHRQSLHRFRDMRLVKGATPEELEEIDELYTKMSDFLASSGQNRTQIKFNHISEQFAKIAVSPDKRTQVEYKDEMANMTLLGKNINSLLSNSVFDVKRGLILDALSVSFIPVCTQRVFLKADTPHDDNQLFFWGEKDRVAYIDRMEERLLPYLPQGYVSEAELRMQIDNKQSEEKPTEQL